MPTDDSPEIEPSKTANGQPISHKKSPNSTPQRRNLFSVPDPIKRIFDRFPLATYPSNSLPARSPGIRAENALYVFSSEEGARRGLPSFNPTCLKWQVCTTQPSTIPTFR